MEPNRLRQMGIYFINSNTGWAVQRKLLKLQTAEIIGPIKIVNHFLSCVQSVL